MSRLFGGLRVGQWRVGDLGGDWRDGSPIASVLKVARRALGVADFWGGSYSRNRGFTGEGFIIGGR